VANLAEYIKREFEKMMDKILIAIGLGAGAVSDAFFAEKDAKVASGDALAIEDGRFGRIISPAISLDGREQTRGATAATAANQNVKETQLADADDATAATAATATASETTTASAPRECESDSAQRRWGSCAIAECALVSLAYGSDGEEYSDDDCDGAERSALRSNAEPELAAYAGSSATTAAKTTCSSERGYCYYRSQLPGPSFESFMASLGGVQAIEHAMSNSTVARIAARHVDSLMNGVHEAVRESVMSEIARTAHIGAYRWAADRYAFSASETLGVFLAATRVGRGAFAMAVLDDDARRGSNLRQFIGNTLRSEVLEAALESRCTALIDAYIREWVFCADDVRPGRTLSLLCDACERAESVHLCRIIVNAFVLEDPPSYNFSVDCIGASVGANPELSARDVFELANSAAAYCGQVQSADVALTTSDRICELANGLADAKIRHSSSFIKHLVKGCARAGKTLVVASLCQQLT
jgi:hypothetical protein